MSDIEPGEMEFGVFPENPVYTGLRRIHLATAVVHYMAAALSDRGRKRPSNEDAFGYSVEDGIYVVCDGMGGAAAGEIASSVAVDEILLKLAGRALKGNAPLPDAAEEAVICANDAVYSRSQRNRRLNGMGTTLVALAVEDRRAWVLNIGDSRCYRMRDGHLAQVTLDHSLVEEQVRMGRMSHSEALRSPLKNVITRALGTQPQVTPDVFEFDARPGDLYLLCTDGLTRELSDLQIESLLGRTLPLKDLCRSLVESAKKAGGHDNITCLLVHAEV